MVAFLCLHFFSKHLSILHCSSRVQFKLLLLSYRVCLTYFSCLSISYWEPSLSLFDVVIVFLDAVTWCEAYLSLSLLMPVVWSLAAQLPWFYIWRRRRRRWRPSFVVLGFPFVMFVVVLLSIHLRDFGFAIKPNVWCRRSTDREYEEQLWGGGSGRRTTKCHVAYETFKLMILHIKCVLNGNVKKCWGSVRETKRQRENKRRSGDNFQWYSSRAVAWHLTSMIRFLLSPHLEGKREILNSFQLKMNWEGKRVGNNLMRNNWKYVCGSRSMFSKKNRRWWLEFVYARRLTDVEY